MNPMPYVVCKLLVFNEERFLDICLSKIIDYADKIIVVEGAVKFFWPFATAEGGSTDQTNEILKNWAGRYPNKFYLIRGKWHEKKDMQNSALSAIPKGTDYLHIVDADEIYCTDSLIHIKEALRVKKPDIVRLGMRHWGYGGRRLVEGNFGVPIHRIFRYVEGFKFAPNTMNVPDKHVYKNVKELVIQNALDHYGHIDPKRSELKIKYYAEREKQWRA